MGHIIPSMHFGIRFFCRQTDISYITRNLDCTAQCGACFAPPIIRHFATPTTSFSNQSFTVAAHYRRIKSGICVFGGVPQCLEEAKQQEKASGDVLPPLLSQLPFVSFSLLSFSLVPFSILSLLAFLICPSLFTIPSFSSDQFSVLDFMFHSVSLLSEVLLTCGFSAVPSPCFKLSSSIRPCYYILYFCHNRYCCYAVRA